MSFNALSLLRLAYAHFYFLELGCVDFVLRLRRKQGIDFLLRFLDPVACLRVAIKGLSNTILIGSLQAVYSLEECC